MNDFFEQNKSIKNLKQDAASFEQFLKSLKSFDVNISNLDQLLKQANEIYEESNTLIQVMLKFIDIFNERSWIGNNSMDIEIMKNSIETYDLKGIDHAEEVLLEYYTDKENLEKIYNSLKLRYFKYARKWHDLIESAFRYHVDKEYVASIPLLLMVIDGIIAKYNDNYGFFSNQVDFSVEESLIFGQIIIVKDICYSSRKKINEEEIFIPYRNGILHGKDINYANEYVSSKLINLFISILDWIDDKKNESKRLSELKKREEIKNKPLSQIVKEIEVNKYNKEYLENWKPNNNITFKNDIDVECEDNFPSSGDPKNYSKYPSIKTLVKFLSYWKQKNYGYLAKLIKLNSRFKADYKSKENNPGLVREVFKNYKLKGYNIIKFTDRALALKIISVELKIETSDYIKNIMKNENGKLKVDFRILSETLEKNIKLDEEIEKTNWVIDSDFFYKMI